MLPIVARWLAVLAPGCDGGATWPPIHASRSVPMSDSTSSIVLEHLRHIRTRVDQIADDVIDVKHRLASLEGSMVLVKREVNEGDATDARQ
jgi:hypothetical protein